VASTPPGVTTPATTVRPKRHVRLERSRRRRDRVRARPRRRYVGSDDREALRHADRRRARRDHRPGSTRSRPTLRVPCGKGAGRARFRGTTQTVRSVAVAAACLALALTGLAGAATGLRVPAVVGVAESRAQCTLAAAGLRWRFRGDDHVHARPVIACSGNVAVNPDPPVISETPRAGSRVVRGSVIVLDDSCLLRARQHRSLCV
jgi:hypothetical protein